MKKALAYLTASFALILIARAVHLPSQILGLLIIGQIPFTSITVPAFMMFFIWVLLPVALLASFYAIKGIFTLTLLVVEYIEYAAKEIIDARRVSKKSATLPRTQHLLDASRWCRAQASRPFIKAITSAKQLTHKMRSYGKSS